MTHLAQDVTDIVSLTPFQAIGIPIALVAAVLMSLGAQYQHQGVSKADADTDDSAKESGLSWAHMKGLIKRPSWLIGTLLLGLAVVLQIVALGFAPLIVVQPIGVVALIVTAIFTARRAKMRLGRNTIMAITACVLGVGLFVATSSMIAKETPITPKQQTIVLIMLAVVLVVFFVAFLFLRRRFKAMLYIVGAGVLYGFVATLAKTILNQVMSGQITWLVALSGVGLLLAVGLGGYFVQSAYASGPPDLVIAGLTVIDPMVAVMIGITVFGEAAGASPLSMVFMGLAGALAIFGVIWLSRHRPPQLEYDPDSNQMVVAGRGATDRAHEAHGVAAQR